ncbi:MAG: class I SAM-dependent methyltransferase [Parvibaculales bacterium]
MDGEILLEKGSLEDLFLLVHENLEVTRSHSWSSPIIKTIQLLKSFWRVNTLRNSRQNVAHHYDLSNAFFAMFLDQDMNYSCAYYKTAGQTLEDAQQLKKQRLLNKLMVSPGHKILDIGCGWGGLALSIGEIENTEVHGITLSENQHDYAKTRTQTKNKNNNVHFHLQDYRTVNEKFDRIISVGMLEHIGRRLLPTYFRKVAQSLNPHGVAVIHSIGYPTSTVKQIYSKQNTWIQKYIFPGGYLPHLSELVDVISSTGLVVTDIEVLSLHYAETLKAWRKNIYKNQAEITSMYDDRFFRMWDFYLVSSEFLFRTGHGVVYQIQLTNDLVSLPRTRDYMSI